MSVKKGTVLKLPFAVGDEVIVDSLHYGIIHGKISNITAQISSSSEEPLCQYIVENSLGLLPVLGHARIKHK